MGSVQEVVGIHHSTDVSLFYGSLKRREINLAHRALVDDRVRIMAVKIGIVCQEVLYCGADSLALQPLDITDGDFRSEIRILSQIFEVSSVHRSAINIDAGTEHKVNALRTRVPSDFLSDASGQCGIPGCRQTNASCHGSCGSVIANTEGPIRHLERRQSQPRERADEHVVNSAKHGHLLFECHPAKYAVHALLDFVCGRRSYWSGGIQSPYKDEAERSTKSERWMTLVHGHFSHGLSSLALKLL